MTTILATKAYKALKGVYSPASKLPKPFSTFPILACVKVEARDSAMRFTMAAFDKETEKLVGNWETIAARTDTDFETCVPARAFMDWLRVTKETAVESDQIELTLDPRTQILRVKAGNTRAEFKCIDAQEFPAATY